MLVASMNRPAVTHSGHDVEWTFPREWRYKADMEIFICAEEIEATAVGWEGV